MEWSIVWWKGKRGEKNIVCKQRMLRDLDETSREVRKINLFLTVVWEYVRKLKCRVKQCEIEEWVIDYKCVFVKLL